MKPSFDGMKLDTMHIPEAKMRQYRETFSLFDADKDGFISVEELVTIFASMGYTASPQEMRELIGAGAYSQYASRGGRIDFDLFTELMAVKMKDIDAELELKASFQKLDAEGRGYVTCHDLAAVMQQLGEDMTGEETCAMVRAAIPTYEGKIYYDCFKRLMMGP